MKRPGRLAIGLAVFALAACTAVGGGPLSSRPGAGEALPAPASKAPVTPAPETASPSAGPREQVPADPPATCPITIPPDPPFVAPKPYPAQPPLVEQSVWYGTPDLWTMLAPGGDIWRALPYYDGAYAQKTFWWSRDWRPAQELQPAITVSGRRLDAPGPTFRAGDPGTNATADFGTAMLVGIDIPAPGCWEIRAAYRQAELAIVVWVDDD